MPENKLPSPSQVLGSPSKLPPPDAVLNQPARSSGTDYSFTGGLANEAATDEIIDKLDTKNDDEKKLIKNIAVAQKQGRATMEDLSNAILTVQGQHPNQDGGNKYYMKEVNGTFLPIPIKNGEKPPKGYDVASVWGSQDAANDDSFMTSAAKHLVNGVIGAAEGIVNLPQIAYGAVTGEELPWYQTMKNSADYLKFKTPDYEKTGQLFDTKELEGVSDFFDPSRYNFNKNNVQGAVLQGLESITSFLVGAKGIGTAAKAVGAGAQGAGLIESGGKLAQGLAGATNTGKLATGFASSYMINYDEALTAAEDAGLEGQDKYAFASVATIPTALLEMVAGTEGLFIKNQLARNGKKEMFNSLAQGMVKDSEGKITKEALEGLYNATTSAANKLNKTFVAELGGNIAGEAGTEAAQAFALNAAKNIYDKVKGEEKFKTDPFSLESFGDYVNNALAGGLGAGGPAVVGVSQKRMMDKAEKQSNNAYETIKKGPEAVSAFKADIDNSVANEELTPEQGEIAKFKVDAYNEYYQQTKGLDLNDDDRKKAFDLSFNIQGIKTEIPTSEADIAKLSPIELAKVQGKKEIVKGLQKELDALILKHSVKKETTVGPDTVNKVVKNEEKKAEETTLNDLAKRYGKAKEEVAVEEPVVKPEKSERRKNAPKFGQQDETGTFEFNKQKPLEKKEILHDYFDENPELGGEMDAFIEGGQNNVWQLDLGGTKQYVQFARSIKPDEYTGEVKGFPGGKQTVYDSGGREYSRYNEPVTVKIQSIVGDKEGRKGKRLRVLNVFNKQTGKYITSVKEKEKGNSDYNEKEVEQLVELQKKGIPPIKEAKVVSVKPKKELTRVPDIDKEALIKEGYSVKNIIESEKVSDEIVNADPKEAFKKLQKLGLFNSVGKLDNWRPDIGLSTKEFDNTVKQLADGKQTATVKKLLNFIEDVQNTGTVKMIGLSGGMTERHNMPLYQFSLPEKAPSIPLNVPDIYFTSKRIPEKQGYKSPVPRSFGFAAAELITSGKNKGKYAPVVVDGEIMELDTKFFNTPELAFDYAEKKLVDSWNKFEEVHPEDAQRYVEENDLYSDKEDNMDTMEVVEITAEEAEEELIKEAAREQVFAETGNFSEFVDEGAKNEDIIDNLRKLANQPNENILEYAKKLLSDSHYEVKDIVDLMIKNSDRIKGNTFFRGVEAASYNRGGVYYSGLGDIYINELEAKGSLNHIGTIIAHEYLHAFTVTALNKNKSERSEDEQIFANKIESIYEALKKDTNYPDEYGFTNSKEFVTGIMTDLRFRHKLKSAKPKLWQRIVNAIIDLFGLYKIGVKHLDNASERDVLIKEAMDQIIDFIPKAKPKPTFGGPYNAPATKKKPFKTLEEMSAKDLSKKLTMSLEAYRENVLGRSLEQIRKDLQFIDKALESDEYSAEQKEDLKAIRQNIKKEEKRDAAKWFAYKEDVDMLSSIMSEGRLEDMPTDKLIEAYNLMTANFQDAAKDAKLDQLKKQIAYRMFVERKEELKDYKKFVEEQANKKDIAAKDVLMKTLSHMTENQPELQKFSKMFDDSYFDMQSDRYDLKTQLEKLGKDVVREKNKQIGITGKLLDTFSSDSTKYFDFVEHPDGRYYTLEEAAEKNFTSAQTKFLKFMLNLNDLRNKQLEDMGIDEVNNDVLKVDKGVREAFKTEGILQAFSSYIGNGFNVRNVRINYNGVPTAYGDIEQDLIKKSKTLADKTKALGQMAYYQLQARRQLKKGVNVDEKENPLEIKETGEYNLSTDGRLKSKFNKPRDKSRGYSKDFYKAAHTFIDDYTHVKHMSALLPYIQSIEHINKVGYKEHGVKNNVAEWVKQWTDLHIFKKNKQGALGPELDVAFKYLRKLTSLMVMAFNVPAAAWNAAMGTYNNIRQESLKEQLKGSGRLLKDGVLNKKAVDILKKYQVVSLDYDSNPKLYAGRLFDMLAHGLTRAGEYYIQGSIFLGYLTDEEYNSFEYKDVNGVKELVVKDGVDEKALKDKLISYKNRVSDIQGKYSDKDRRNYMAGEFGKLVGQFRTWLPDAFKQRFGEEYIDRDGVVHKGSYRAFIGQGFADLKADIREKGIKGLTENKEAMANLKGLMVVAAFMSLRLGGSDDDKRRKKGDLIDQALGNLLYAFDIDQLKFMVKNPIAAQATVSKFVNVMEDAMKLDVDKGVKDVKKALPYGKSLDIVEQLVED
jgi:hypothetical protein